MEASVESGGQRTARNPHLELEHIAAIISKTLLLEP